MPCPRTFFSTLRWLTPPLWAVPEKLKDRARTSRNKQQRDGWISIILRENNRLQCNKVCWYKVYITGPVELSVFVAILDTADEKNNGLENEDLIVWMRTAALPNFR